MAPLLQKRVCRPIGSLSGSAAVAQVRSAGTTRRRGPIRVSYLRDAADTSPLVALSVPRRVGTAVVRNRIRRRVKAVLRELAQAQPDAVPPGRYLISVYAPLEGVSSHELRHVVSQLLGRV